MKALLATVLIAAGLIGASVADATPTLSVQPQVCNGCSHTVSWSNITAPTSTDWIGLYAPGAANTSFIKQQYTTGAANGSISFSFPSSLAFGNYELRLFSNNTFNLLATTTTTVSPTVSGTITNFGSGLSGVSIALNGTACMTTGSDGSWGCFVTLGWSGTITPSRGGYLFSPASRSLSNVTNHVSSQNFATASAVQVSGTVTRGGSPFSGVPFSASNGGSCTSSNASGQYTCAVPSGWSGTITPSYADTTFTPASRSYTNVSSPQTAQDYTAVTQHQISGTVTLNGLAVPNVVFAAPGASCTASDTSGQYTCTVPDAWTGTVTPSESGYSFTPASRNYTNLTSSQNAQTYTATLASATAPIYFVHVDHLDTPRLVADASGTTVWKWDQQEPFSDSVPDENPSGLGTFDLPLRLPGQRYDQETGLHYNYYRDYDPSLGIYKQSDLIGLRGGLNTYAYVLSNPLRRRDPQGLFGEWPDPSGPPPMPLNEVESAGYISIEAFYAGRAVGGGITWLTCTDDCGKKHRYRYRKICTTALSGAGVSVGAVQGMSGKNCKDPTRYEGLFSEFGYGYMGGTVGGDIGFAGGKPSGVNEAGIGLGTPGPKAAMCYYILWPEE